VGALPAIARSLQGVADVRAEFFAGFSITF
jgi:hypothetical protein